MASASTSTAKEINVTFQLLSGSDVHVTLPPNCTSSRASELISEALSIGDAGDLVLVDAVSGKRILLSCPVSSKEEGAGKSPPPPLLLFEDGAVVLALPAPSRPPPERVRSRRGADGETTRSSTNSGGAGAEDDDSDGEDDPFLWRPPENKLARLLAESVRSRRLLPDPLLAVLVRVPRGFWLFLALWPLGAKIASRFSLGPLFILLSIVAAIFSNLGERSPGEASAYSVFNVGFRSLLGEYRAENIDDGLRRGNL